MRRRKPLSVSAMDSFSYNHRELKATSIDLPLSLKFNTTLFSSVEIPI